ncbi:uncharacterized protein LOC119724279 [Patiria miniata]|uniref:Uncharacterized protein n=1 Tax=Patiria miniata TaxID=46514 RepID=A0A913ZJG0_PATMI|nr:uncharacterized protein LOC119724279 [Patiria miniata]
MLATLLVLLSLLISGVSPKPLPDITHASMRFAASRRDSEPHNSLHRSKRFISTSLSDRRPEPPLRRPEWRDPMMSAASLDSAASMVSKLLRGSVDETLPVRLLRQEGDEVPVKRFIGLESSPVRYLTQTDREGHPDDSSMAMGSHGDDGAPPAKDLISRLMANRYHAAPSTEGAVPPEVKKPPLTVKDEEAINMSALEILLKRLLREKLAKGEDFAEMSFRK